MSGVCVCMYVYGSLHLCVHVAASLCLSVSFHLPLSLSPSLPPPSLPPSLSHTLSLSPGGAPVGNSYYGGGTGPAVLNEFSCSEDASGLDDCQFTTIPSDFCSSHRNDAGVSCTGIHTHITYSLDCMHV